MEPENPHYDGGKPFIICKLSTNRTTPAVARVFPPAVARFSWTTPAGGGEVSLNGVLW